MEEARLALRRTESFLLKRESKRKEKRKEPTRYMKIKSLIAWMLKSFAYVIGIEQIASEKVINDFETAEQFKDYCHVNGCYTMADFLGYKGMSREWDVYEEEYLSDANEELQMIIEKFTNKSWILQCQNSYCRENDLKLEYSERVEGLPLLMTMLKPKDVLATGYTVAMSELIGLQYSEPKSRPDGGVMFMSKLANKVNIALLEEKKLDQIIRAGQLKKLLLTVQIKESGKAKETLQYIEENPNKTFDEIYKWANASNSQKIATSRISKKSKKKDSAIREANVIERKNDKKPKGNSKEKGTYDKSKVECFNCGEFGHYKNECTSEKGMTKSDKQEKARNGPTKKRVGFKHPKKMGNTVKHVGTTASKESNRARKYPNQKESFGVPVLIWIISFFLITFGIEFIPFLKGAIPTSLCMIAIYFSLDHMKELKIHEILTFVPFRNERKKGKPKMKRFKTKRKRKYPDKYSKPKRIWTEEDCRKGWERLFSEGRPCQKNGARAPYAKFGYNVTKNMAPKKNTSSPIQTSEPKVRSIREIGENGRKKETTNKENGPWWIPFIIGITLFRADILIVPVMTIFISILAGIVLIDILFQIVNKSLFGLQKGINKCIQRPVKISVPISKGYAEGVWSAT
jgi:hypothetical protein